MISMLFEKPFKQARVADHAIAAKNLNLGRSGKNSISQRSPGTATWTMTAPSRTDAKAK
jgi:hypothetical protein